MKNFQQLVISCEEDIRSGKAHLVAKRLSDLPIARIPREFRLPLAKICRRAGLLPLGLKLLTKIVHAKSKQAQAPASDAELAEYAVLLTRAGAPKEAVELLASVNTQNAPDAYLYRAYAQFTQWDFENAIPDLLSYLRTGPAAYWRLVGQINLAYAYVSSGHFNPALTLLDEVIENAKGDPKTKLLHINALELKIRLHVLGNDLTLAENAMNLARRLVDSHETNEAFLLEKWAAIIHGIKHKDPAAIQNFRAKAISLQRWDEAREADRYSLRGQFDERVFNHLIFGTPFETLRQNVYKETGRRPESTHYILGNEGGSCFDVESGELEGTISIDRGRKCHQLIEVLSRDFYKPMKLGELYVELFPGEHFNIFSSPNRVHQVLFRTREWLQRTKLPMRITENDGYYRLITENGLSLKVPLNKNKVSIYDGLFEKLEKEFHAGQELSAKDIREKLGIPRTTFFRFSNWAVSSGRLERTGNSRFTKYKLFKAA